jgi:L-asparaginase
MKKVLVINTGGTIGMVHSEKGNFMSPLKSADDWNEIAANYPLLNEFDTGYIQVEELIDSSDMKPNIWIDIAKIIELNYHKYCGFVVLHGTDTMAFTSSALAFMLKNLDKPVILTGSQVPLENPRSDAMQNLVTAIQIAGSDNFDIPLVPEVCIFFRDTLLRGNRARKLDASNYYGFSAPNYSNLGIAGSDININKARIRKPSRNEFFVDYSLDSNVLIFDIFPGFNFDILRSIFKNNKIHGLILKTYGNGNAPTNDEFITVIEEIIESGVVIVNISQCPTGMVKMGLYDASTRLLDAGVVSGMDMTPEAAVAKLMHLLGTGYDKEKIRQLIQRDICGEQSSSLFAYKVSEKIKSTDNSITYRVDIDNEIDPKKIKSTKFRIKGLNLTPNEILEIKISSNYRDERITLKNQVKSVKREIEITQDFLTSFTHSTQSILKKQTTLYFTIKTNYPNKWESIYFDIFVDTY